MVFLKKAISWIKTHRVISVIIFLFLFLVILLFPSGNKKNNSSISPSPSENSQVIVLPTVYPAAGIVQMGGSQAAISLFFEEPIDPSTIKIQAVPDIGFKVGVLADFPNRVILTPQQNWASGSKYVVTVFKGIKTLDGQKELKQDIVINYSIQTVPTPQFME